MASENTITLTDNNFNQEVLQSPIPVLVDFWAEWCGPCQRLAPVLDQLGAEYAGRFKIAKVNIDQYPQLAAPYNVMSIPNMVIFKGGKVARQVVGYKSSAELKGILDSVLA